MKYRIVTLCLAGVVFAVNAQKLEYSASALGFADNREYQSKYQNDQSMLGIRLAPEIGAGVGEYHHLRVGVDVLKEFGREMNKNDVEYTAYYHYNKQPFAFYFGSFPRRWAVGEFPAPFFQDSLTYYCPNVNGFVWRYETAQGNASLFLDWTGRQSAVRRESFTAGSAGIYRKGIFYGKYQFTYRHYALLTSYGDEMRLHDNGLLHLAAGIDFTSKTSFDTLYINAGYLVAQERRRGNGAGWKTPQGLFAQAQAEWRRIGIKNTLYAGEGLMYFRRTPYNPGGDLYTGDPYYQAKFYNRTDLYINLITSAWTNARFDWSFHYDGYCLSSQQQFILTVNINNENIKAQNSVKKYFWNKK